MYKIYLAVGHRELEMFLKNNKTAIEKKMKTPVKFVGETVYREGIIQGVSSYKPDVILIREGLQGNANLTEIIYKIKVNFPQTRIIFIAGDREVGDELLATLVQYGIYDLIIGSKVNAVDMLKKIVKANSFSDVAHLMPKATVDERTNKKIFEAPDLTPIETTTNETTEKRIEPIKPIPSEQETVIKPKEEKTHSTTEEDDELLILDEDEDEEEVKTEEVTDAPKKVEEETENPNSRKRPLGLIPLKKNQPQVEVSTPKAPEVQVNLTQQQQEPLREETKAPKVNKDNELKIKVDKEPIKVVTAKKETQTPSNEKQGAGFFGKIFGGNKEVGRRVSQQVITFVGGRSGVGNSQLAFNTALTLSQNGYRVMYIDLNDRFSSADCIFQLGYSDVGVDTALKAISEENYGLIDRSIVNMNKILPDMVKENHLYKTYTKIGTNIDFMFFSQEYMERVEDDETIDYSLLKDLNMYLMMQQGYDMIILDTPANLFNRISEMAIVYSNKLFFTVTQDYATIGNHINQIKLMDKKRIKFREKFYYLLNKYEPANLSINDVYRLLVDSTKLEGFNVVPIPNLNKEFINANYDGVPIIWYSKNKELGKSFSEIETLILR